MRKNLFVIIMTMIIVLTFGSTAFAANETIEAILNKKISIVYNEELKEFSDVTGTKVYPISYQGTTYLPVRAISALFNIPVTWDGDNNKVLLGKGELDTTTAKSAAVFVEGTNENITPYLNKSIQIEYKEKLQTFTDVNGTVVYPLSYKGTTYLPVRAISNLYGAEINWNDAEKKITIVRENKIAKITNVTIKVVDDTLCAAVTTDNPLYDYKYYSLTEPNRIILDLQNSTFGIDTEAKSISYDVLEQVRFGKQDNNVNRLVLDVKEIGTYTVTQTKDRKITYLALDEKFELAQEESKDFVLVASIGDKMYYIPEDNNESSGENVNIDIPNEEVTSGDNGDNEENITSGDEEDNVISGDEIEVFGESISGEILNSGDAEEENQENEKDEEVPTYGEKEDEEEDVLTPEEIEKLAKVTSVIYSSSTNKTKINVTGNYEYERFILNDPPRLVIDIEGALLNVDGPTEITPKNKNIKEIRFSQNEIDKVRVVFELAKESDYEITEKSKYLEVSVEEPAYRNVEYVAKDGYATLTLLDVKKKVFDMSETAKYNRCTITYSSSKFDSGKATLEIDDKFVEKITIRTNKITINGADKVEYEMKQDGDNVVITISPKGTSNKDKSDGDFVVLIDAGHGGSDPGACHNGGKTLAEQEKTYTLAVMLKLMDLLEDTDGIEVRASRTKDVYIDREGRLDFVLDNPDADLLVSVHINSLANKQYKGTMVLFYNKPNEKEDYGITSKELALLVKDNLVEDLDLVDRGVVSREDLWILEQNAAGVVSNTVGEDRPVTNLPAILCELCFISNEEDFAKLQTEDFQEGAALAIYNGILAAKEQMED